MALGFYRRYPLLFALLALGVVAPYELIVLAATGKTPFGVQRGDVATALTLALVDFVIVGPLISALYIHAVRTIGNGERPTFAAVINRGVRVLPTVAAAQIVATLAVAAGFLALVVPGIFLLVRLAVAAQAAAIENENWIEALRRSWQLTGGNGLHVLGLLFATGVISFLLRDAGVAVAGTHAQVQYVVLAIVVETIARSFVALCAAVLFFDLTARRVQVR